MRGLVLKAASAALAGVFAAAFLMAAPAAVAQAPSAPPSAADFSASPDFWSPALSPDGTHVAMIAEVNDRHVLGVVDIAAGTGFRAIRSVGTDEDVFIDWVRWKDDERLLYGVRQRREATGRSGDRMGGTRLSREFDLPRVYAINRDGGDNVIMFNQQQREIAFGIVRVIDTLVNDPDHVLLAAPTRGGLGLFRANVRNGQAEQIADGRPRTAQWVTDISGAPVMRIDTLPRNSGLQMFRRGPGQTEWVLAFEARRAAATQGIAFSPLGPTERPGVIYVLARPDGAPLASLYAYDTATGAYREPLSPSAQADVFAALIRPSDHSLMASCIFAERLACTATSADFQRRWAAVEGFFDNAATISVPSLSANGRRMILMADGPQEPDSYYLFDVDAMSIEPLAARNGALVGAALSPIEIVRYAARDGQALWGYLTRPAGQGPMPLVVMPHGGPEARDFYGFDFLAQFLASRGYMVFQPNFRGGSGFGRTFTEAGYRGWGGVMQNDVTDGVQHLIQTGIADANRICIVGGSYGGYVSGFAPINTPDLYRCSVPIAGVFDLLDMLTWERRDSGAGSVSYNYWITNMGDPSTDRDRLIATSPTRQAAQVRIPMLVVHGDADDIVPVEQSRDFVAALRAAGAQVDYVEFPEAGHTWASYEEEQRAELLTRIEAFLAQHIGR